MRRRESIRDCRERESCEQLVEYDAVITEREAEVVTLRARITELRAPVQLLHDVPGHRRLGHYSHCTAVAGVRRRPYTVKKSVQEKDIFQIAWEFEKALLWWLF